MRHNLIAQAAISLPYIHLANVRSKPGLESLVGGIAAPQCQDSRDRIYGILGMCEDRIARRIQPNYEKNPRQIYIEFTRAFMEEYHSLDLLRFCDLATRDDNLASWIPDFTHIVPHTTQFVYAAGESRPKFHVSNTGVLNVFGIAADRVQMVSSSKLRGTADSIDEAFHVISAW